MLEAIKRLRLLLFILAGLLVINAFGTPGFFKVTVQESGRLYGVPIDILFYGSRVMLLAISMSLVIATGGIDLSVGAIMALAGSTAAVMVNANHPIAVALLAAFAIAAAAGATNGVLVAVFGLQPIIATLVFMVAGRGIAQLLAGMPIVTFTSTSLKWFAAGHFLGFPVAVWIVFATFLVVWAVTRRTALGLMIEALGDNPNAARAVGIPVVAIKISVYVISGLCAALAGFIDAAAVTAADTYTSGLNLELDAILAVVIGGTALTGGRFYLGGSILGAILLQSLTTTLLLRDVNPNLLTLPKSVLVIVVCVLASRRTKTWLASLRTKPAAGTKVAGVA